MTTCDIESCSIDAVEDSDKCILHCEKGSYGADYHKPGFLNQFYKKLIDYIVEAAFETSLELDGISRQNLSEHLEGSSSGKKIGTFSKGVTMVVACIVFPDRDGRDHFDYLKVLNKVGAFHFYNCHFNLNRMDLGEVKCFYDGCIFHSNWIVRNVSVLGNVNNVLYQQCVFRGEVSAYPEDDKKSEIACQLFNDCDFRKRIEFGSLTFKAPIFNNTNDGNIELPTLRLLKCNIEEKFVLNKCEIGQFLAEDSVFGSKFEFKNNSVGEFSALNTNFLKIADSHETIFEKFTIKKCIFEDFVGFERCIFGEKIKKSAEYTAKFIYVTFYSFANFRNTRFASGLDIQSINVKEAPNFLNSEISPDYSNRETFRIIKNSFDKSGNFIEANRFFSQEMRKYREELRATNNYSERLVLFLNEKISNFGQSYVRPILLIIAAAIIYSLIVLGYEHNYLDAIHPKLRSIIEFIHQGLNGMSKNILPFSRILKGGMEFVSLLFYITFTVLVWQTIIAIKRNTKR